MRREVEDIQERRERGQGVIPEIDFPSLEWHSTLLPALTSIPVVEPGDTVWWHPDVGHAVEDVNGGEGYSNVVYVGSAPDWPKNATYLQKQKEAFLARRSAPDFAPEDYEVDFEGRATVEDLTPLGRRQTGVEAW
jgi:hypothetical protein